MNKDKQRIAIAGFCGRTVTPFGESIFKHPKTWRTLFDLPDYLNDRNAIAEALHFLTDEEHGKFRAELVSVVTGKRAIISLMSAREYRAWFSATAQQQAEAFLKTVNRWEDGE